MSFTDFDVNDFIGHEQRQAAGIATQSLEDNPDDAARAMKLADATGVHPAVIHGDLENFEREQKAGIATSIINDNKFIQDYINGHSMAAKVSNDDYGQLDALSQALGEYGGDGDGSVLKAGIKGFVENAKYGELDSEGGKLAVTLASHPIFGNIFVRHALTAGAIALEGSMSTFSGVVGGASAMVADYYKQMGGSESDANKLTRDLITWAQVGLSGQAGLHGPVSPELHGMISEASRMAKVVEPFVTEGKEPLVGVHPVVDEFKQDQAKLDKDNLNKALKEAVGTSTRERSPDLAEHFISGITQGDIGISADAVRKLYGDKVPAPGDGILGDVVPDLAAQLQRAEATGGDIKVGLAKYLARVEPEVHRELEDHVRARPEGMTVEEGKEPLDHITRYQPVPLEPVDTVRQASGLQPIPEAKLSFERGEDVGTSHVFGIKDGEKDLGEFYVAEEAGGKRLYIDDVRSKGGPGSIGPSAIREATAELFRQFPNADEIKGLRVSGAREKAGEKYSDMVVKRPKGPKQPELPVEGTTRMEDRAAFAPAPPGFTVDMYKRWQKAVEKQREDDAAAVKQWALEDSRKRETAEWKANRKGMREDVAGEFAKRPEFVLDEMLRSQGLKLDASKLTPEQIAALPPKYLASVRRPGRVDPEVLAQNLGAESGTELVNRLVAVEQSRKQANMKPREFFQRAIDIETDARMEKQFGNLDKNVLERAYDHIMSTTQEDILHEETLRYATLAGQEFPIKKQPVVDQMHAEIGQQKMGDLSSKELLADAGRAARSAEKAELEGDYAEAFKHAQRRENAFLQAREAAKIEKLREKFEATADRYLKREVTSTPPEYTNAIHSILDKLSYPIKRMPEDLTKEMAGSGYKGLADFIVSKENQHKIEGVEFDVPDFLLDDKFKATVDDLTADQFKAVKAGVDNLIHVGREEKKVLVGGAKADLRMTIKDMHEQLKAKWPAQTISVKKENAGKQLLNSALAASTNLETLFQRFDGRDPNGLFTRTFVYPGAEAANYKARLEQEFGAKYKALGEIPDKNKKLADVPLRDPVTGERVKDFTREHLASVISNMGNEYNWRTFTEGWKVDPELLRGWVEQNSTRADFDRAHALSKIFDEGKRMSDVVYRNIKGVAPQDIPLQPFEMHGKEYPGWYHPIIRHDKLSEAVTERDPTKKPINFWPTTPNGYVKRRTGAVDVLATDYALIPAKLNQILHDVAFRDFITNSAKITRDKEFRSAVSRHYGKEYVEEINQWVERVAGNGSYNSEALSRATKASNFLRQNVITTHIAFNLGTIEKHATTAAVMSAKELGPNTITGALKLGKLTAEIAADSLYHATMDLFGKSEHLGESISKFIDNTSEEIQRRERHYQDTVTDVHSALQGDSSIRQKVAYWGAKGVAISDKISAKPLWLGKYREVMGETGDHGLAVSQANLSVRRAHGSTAITSLPRVAAGGGVLEPWLTSLYGFMGANMQRRIEIAHDVSDAYKLAKGGELSSALKKVPGIADSVFANVVWVGLVEEAVSSQFTEDKRTGLTHALAFTFGTMAQTIIGLRDFTYGLTHGREPQVGLASGLFQELTNVFHNMQKPHPLSAANAGKFVGDAIAAVGDMTGVGPKPIARAARYGIDIANKRQTPRSGTDVWHGVMTGQQKLRVER